MIATFKHGSTIAARYKKLGGTGLLLKESCIGTQTSSTPASQHAATGGVQQDKFELITARALDAVIHLINMANGAR